MTDNDNTLGDDLLFGRGEIAAAFFGADTPENRRRITGLMREVRPADRIPFFLCGGKPSSRRSWLEQYTRARAQNLVDVN
jgi:hypothetical protein